VCDLCMFCCQIFSFVGEYGVRVFIGNRMGGGRILLCVYPFGCIRCDESFVGGGSGVPL